MVYFKAQTFNRICLIELKLFLSTCQCAFFIALNRRLGPRNICSIMSLIYKTNSLKSHHHTSKIFFFRNEVNINNYDYYLQMNQNADLTFSGSYLQFCTHTSISYDEGKKNVRLYIIQNWNKPKLSWAKLIRSSNLLSCLSGWYWTLHIILF